jgi:hypothetical protein
MMVKKYNTLFFIAFSIYILSSLIWAYSGGYESEKMFHRLSSLGKIGSCYILCVGILHLSAKKINSFTNLVSFGIAVLLTEIEFFEGILYQIMSYDFNVNLGNSQYPKLICFIVIFLLLILKFLFVRKNFTQFFNILAMAAVITTTIIFHKVIVKESYVEMRDLNLERFKLFQYLPDQSLFIKCSEDKLICFSWDSEKKIKKFVGNELLSSKLSQTMAKEDISEGTLIYETQFDFGDSEESLDLENVLVIKQRVNKSLRFVFDTKSPGLIRDKFFKLFYILSGFAHIFWSLFMFYLIRLHYNRKFCLKTMTLN